MTYRPTISQAVMGLLFIGMGLLVIVLVATDSMTERDGSGWLVALFGGVFVLVGLGILEVHRLWSRRIRGPNIDWSGLWPGLLVSLVGIFFIIISFTDSDENFNAPRWVVTLAGGVFLSAGLLVLKNLMFDKGQTRTDDLFTGLIAGLLMTCFAGVALGIVLDPEGQVESTAQLVFAPGAVILSILTVVTWYNVLKHLIRSLWPRLQAAGVALPAILIALFAVAAIVLLLISNLPRRSPDFDRTAPTATQPF